MKVRFRALPALCMMPLAALSLQAQALTPDPDPRSNDTTCLGYSQVQNEETLQFETYMKSAVNLSPIAREATLPLHMGYAPDGSTVYYIMTDTSDCDTARQLGINYSPKLGNLLNPDGSAINASLQTVAVTGDVPAAAFNDQQLGMVHFSGYADFSPIRTFLPGTTAPASPPWPPNSLGWPPAQSTPGSIDVCAEPPNNGTCPPASYPTRLSSGLKPGPASGS